MSEPVCTYCLGNHDRKDCPDPASRIFVPGGPKDGRMTSEETQPKGPVR